MPRLKTAEPEGGARFYIFLAAAVIAAGLGAFGVLHIADRKTAAAAEAPASETFEAGLSQRPALVRMQETIKQRWPDEYATLQRKTAKDRSRGDVQGVAEETYSVGYRLARINGKYAAHAETSKQIVVLQSAANLYVVMDKLPDDLCNRVLDEKLRLSDASMIKNAAFLEAGTAMIHAALEAGESGRTKPVKHAPPTNADNGMLGQTILAMGVSMESLMTDDMKDVPAAERCDLIVKVMRATLATPEPARSRLVGAMMADFKF